VILFYKTFGQKNHHRLLDALYKYAPTPKYMYNTVDFSSHSRMNMKADAIVFAGIIRGSGNIFKWCINNKKRFLYLDHAYINRGYNEHDPGREWMRITDSGFLWNKMVDQSSARWDEFFSREHQLSPWMVNKSRPNILVLPPSLSTQALYPDSKEWISLTLKALRENTNRNIVIREKPLQVETHSITNQVIRPVKIQHARTIDSELADAYCVVTYNSAVAVQATIMGIPVFTSPNAAAAPMSINLTEIDNPAEPQRQRWLDQLVHHQFRTREMLDGTIWDMIYKIDNNDLSLSAQ